jgi:DNA-binding GntR family transcriptional regulator
VSVSGGMMEGVEQIDQPGTLTEQTVRRLHRAILAGELAPGRRYSTAAIAGQLGVSRTPVREAALQLERMGLVAIERNRGIRILTTSVEQLLQGYELRLMLELPLVERAVGQATDTERAEVDRVHEAFRQAAARGDDEGTLRCDRDYHMALLRGAHNGRALRVLEELRTMVLVSGVGTVPTSRSAQECFDDHADVHVAWLRRDAAGVREALGRHIVHTASILIRQESRRRPDFAEDVDVHERLGWLLR